MKVVGNALSFNGLNQYSDRAAVSTAVNNLSIVLWAYVYQYPAPGSIGTMFNNGANDANGYELRMNATGLFSFDVAFVANVPSDTRLVPLIWYQLAVIRSNGNSQCYVNAVPSGLTKNSTPNAPNTNSSIGASETSGAVVGRFFNGLVDDVRLYERAIDPNELAVLYARASQPRIPDISSANLKLWCQLDEVGGTTAFDSSTNKLNFTNKAFPLWMPGYVATYASEDILKVNKNTGPQGVH